MTGPYRDELDALRSEVEILREELSRAHDDGERLERAHDALEVELRALEDARVSALERDEAARRVGLRGMAWGLAGGLLVAASLGSMAALWPTAAPTARVVGADGWLAHVRPRCNAVEVESSVLANPPPRGPEGQANLAACYALAGRDELAATVLDAMPADQRRTAAGRLYALALPIAEGGDPASAAPVMELVVAHAPDLDLARYHAGVGANEAGDAERAEAHLARFVAAYRADDHYLRDATRALEDLRHGRHAELAPDPYRNRAPWR
ncbi:MAG: hypothetical protein KC619_11675 [Myxococcales bacterium]|nr:hypothetical protein [Myxococcales bacterium]